MVLRPPLLVLRVPFRASCVGAVVRPSKGQGHHPKALQKCRFPVLPQRFQLSGSRSPRICICTWHWRQLLHWGFSASGPGLSWRQPGTYILRAAPPWVASPPPFLSLPVRREGQQSITRSSSLGREHLL